MGVLRQTIRGDVHELLSPKNQHPSVCWGQQDPAQCPQQSLAVQALNKLQASSLLCFHSHEALVHELLQRRLFLASPRRLLLQEAFLRLSAQFRRPLWSPLMPYFHQHTVSPSGVATGRDPYCVSRPAQG